MATQKNIKSSRSATSKSKSSKSAAPKKAAPRPLAKGKAAGKSSAAHRPKVAVKKASPVKGKKPAPVVKKAAVAKGKAAPKKVSAVKAAPKGKPAATKAKTVVKHISKPKQKDIKSLKPVKKATVVSPVLKKVSAPKAGPAPKSVAVAKAASASKKPAISKPVVQLKGKVAPQKPVIATGSSKPKAPVHPTIKPGMAAKPIVSKGVVSKPVTTFKPKPVVSPAGSKVSDHSGKPSVSTNLSSAKHAEPSKPTSFKPSKPITGPIAKPFVKMTEKKEYKPVLTAATSEEPHKSRYTDKELEEFDQLIDQKLIVAREQLEFYLKQLEDMAENPDNKIKGLDDGLSTLESERVSSMAARQQKLIQHLENAKIRIKNKVYGICRETGKLISKERLRAVPHATLSIEAKQAQN